MTYKRCFAYIYLIEINLLNVFKEWFTESMYYLKQFHIKYLNSYTTKMVKSLDSNTMKK